MKKISLTAIMLTVGLRATAFDYAKNVCDNGGMKGCSAVGLAYRNGYGGVIQNYSKAKEYYRKACDLGDADGCKKYAEMRCVKID